MKLVLLPMLTLIGFLAQAETPIAELTPNRPYTVDAPIEFGVYCQTGKGGMEKTANLTISSETLNGRKLIFLASKSSARAWTSKYIFVFAQEEITGPSCLLVRETYIGWAVSDGDRFLPLTEAK